jgi:long-subunit fatty acid transport protein
MMRENLYNKQMMLLPDKRTHTLIFIACASFTRVVYAQPPYPTFPTLTFPLRPEPVGSGARALGQSAFIAVADDATAASWNPAGLRSLETPETSFVGAWRTTTKDYSQEDDNLRFNTDRWKESQINFMSYAQPIMVGNTHVGISVNYHQVYDFGMEYNKTEIDEISFYGGTRMYQVEGKSEGAVAAYSLAGGLSIPSYPEIAIGASFNWYTQSLSNSYTWQAKTFQMFSFSYPDWPSFGPFLSEREETYDNFRGHNFTFGILWDVYEKRGNMLTLGLVYHTPFTAKLDRKEVYIDPWNSFDLPQYNVEIDFPPSLGAGVNYRISDTLSVAFDVEWKEWSKLKQEIEAGWSFSPFNSDTVTYRLGGEHLTFSKGGTSVLAYRAGLFYEEFPAPYSDPMPVYGPSVGLGWTVKEQFSLDFAYQFRRGEQDDDYYDYEIREHFLVGSFVKYF